MTNLFDLLLERIDKNSITAELQETVEKSRFLRYRREMTKGLRSS